MALIKCPNCGKKVSDKATLCPHCSNTVASSPNKKKDNHFFAWFVSIISIIAGLASFPAGFLIILAGIIICPKFQNFLKEKTSLNISKIFYVLTYLLLLAFSIVIIISPSDDNTKTTSITSNNISTTYKPKYTDLNNFDYTINNNTLRLTRYNGSKNTVKISSSYTINNVEYTVTELEDAIFNCTNVNKVYIPKTIISITDNLLASYL